MKGFKHYLTGKALSDSTVKWYNMNVLDFIAWLDKDNTDIDNATAGDITAYLNYLKKKGQANITRRNSLISIRHFLDWRVKNGVRPDTPALHINICGYQHKILYPPMSIQELESIYHSYSVPTKESPLSNRNWYVGYRLSRERNKVMLGLLVWQGLTTAEISSLAVNDLKLKEGTLYIAGGRKSNERTLELKPQQIIGLMEYLMQTRKELLQYSERKESEKLFIPSPVAGRKQISDNNALNVWKRLTMDIKEQHPRFVNFLQVRTSVIVHWLKQYNLRQVQYMAGHRYVSSTEAYQIGNMEALSEDIGKYHPIS